MSILSFFRRRAMSRYAKGKAAHDLDSPPTKTKLSAFEAAMEESRREDAEVWAKLRRDFKLEP